MQKILNVLNFILINFFKIIRFFYRSLKFFLKLVKTGKLLNFLKEKTKKILKSLKEDDPKEDQRYKSMRNQPFISIYAKPKQKFWFED